MDLNNNLEEIVIADPEKEFNELCREAEKEEKKETLQRITRDMKAAENKKDALSIRALMKEAQKITEELSRL